jgi:hypothetical protein
MFLGKMGRMYSGGRNANGYNVLSGHSRTIGNTGQNIFLFQLGIGLKDRFYRFPGCEIIQYEGHPYPGVFNAGLSETDFRIGSYAVEKIVHSACVLMVKSWMIICFVTIAMSFENEFTEK